MLQGVFQYMYEKNKLTVSSQHNFFSFPMEDIWESLPCSRVFAHHMS